VTAEFVRLIGISSALHDIGKVGIEDSILRKPGPLTPAQRKRMETHAMIGAECLRGIERRLGGSNFLQMAREITLAHHERWDGTGYPDRLAGEAIPLAARIVAVADVYDALSSVRVYKERHDHQQCLAYITGQAGKQFDPQIVEVWQGIESRFRAIAKRWRDRSTPAAVQVEFADRSGADQDARLDDGVLAETATDA
ncbi:MAG: HD domain-containing protein, partial [Planctomycetes bacterium]|nr:HD domain-containing protein [Planctomycetota bacterium]